MDKPFALIVEEDRYLAALFRHVLDLAGFRTEIASQGELVVKRLSNSQPALVILDLDLPGISGGQILDLIRKDERLRHGKVIAVTSHAQIADSLSAEPDLLLFKPIGMEQFSDFIERFQLKIKYQTTIPLRGEPWDRVTGLYNQSFFTNRLENAFTQAREIDQYLFAVLTVNFDQDNRIKDQLDIRGWIAALRETAEILKTAVRPIDTIARFDQDNFYVLVENIPNKDIPLAIAARVQRKLHEKLADLGAKVEFPIRIGILLCYPGYENVNEILEDAKIARSLGRSQGAGFFDYYDRTSSAG
jgi:diguanylate cyclase (GGDEF)-like protein